MAKTAKLNIRVDPDTKEVAEKLFANFGITISDAVNIFLHKAILSGGIPFEIKLSQPNATTKAAMLEVDNMIRGKIETYEQSVDDFFKDMILHEKD
jgi:DNA-damage-inducible protein J